MNSRREFIVEGLKQSAFVFLVAILLVVLGVVLAYSPLAYLLGRLLLYVIIGAMGMLVGPGPVFFTLFDISDRQLLCLSCAFIIFYWLGLGMAAGSAGWRRRIKEKLDGVEPDQKAQISELRAWISIMAIVGGIFFFFDNPANYSPWSGPHFPRIVILNNLAEIEFAKSIYSTNSQALPGYVPTEADLKPYLNLKHVGPEHYVFGALSNAPYAVLDTNWWIPRFGWHQGYWVGTNGTEFHLRK